MVFKRIWYELMGLRDEIESKSRKVIDQKHFRTSCGRSHIAPELCTSSTDIIEQGQWENIPPELLLDIIKRVETSETTWPARKAIVACASVCSSWRYATKEIVKPLEYCGWITFPISLKQPGPRDHPIQCYIKRERATSVYCLFLGLGPGNGSKMLLAAKKVRRTANTEFLISLDRDDFSRTSSMYIGKLRSNFLGTKFTIYDTYSSKDIQAVSSVRRCGHSNHISPNPTSSKSIVATVCYELNILRTRGPRRMHCFMHSIPFSAIQQDGTAPTPTEALLTSGTYSIPSVVKQTNGDIDFSSTSLTESSEIVTNGITDPLILENKTPRWHAQLQCWCLNFKGRVTVASVKNFQLVASVELHRDVSSSVEREKVILQFGKIGKDIFTMDYRYPLSAFQAFAICLSSFDTKPACE